MGSVFKSTKFSSLPNHTENSTEIFPFVIACIICLLLLYAIVRPIYNPTPVPDNNLNNYTLVDALNLTGSEFWTLFTPSFECPSVHLLPIGRDGDGRKWTCGILNLANMARDCLVYSFGVSDDSSFEAEILATLSNCHVFAFDHTVDSIGPPLKSYNPRVNFFPIGLSNEDSGEKNSLKSIMTLNNHEFIDILKIDVEGDEYNSLQKFLDGLNNSKTVPVGQLLVEFHLFTSNFHEKENLLNIFRRLENKGMRLFHIEENIYGEPGCCAEFSFINANYIDI